MPTPNPSPTPGYSLRIARELGYDLRTAFARLRTHAPSMFASLMILALCVGANVAVFQALEFVMWRPLPVAHASDLVQVDVVRGGQPRSFSYPHLRALIERQDVLEGVFGTFDFVAESVRVPDSGTQLGVNCRLVTGSYFESLGISAASGRAIGTRDDDPAAPSVAVVSDGLWKRILAGRSDAVGTAIQVNGVSTTIVGIAPAWFFGEHVGTAPDLWLTMSSASALSFGWVKSPAAARQSGRAGPDGAGRKSRAVCLSVAGLFRHHGHSDREGTPAR